MHVQLPQKDLEAAAIVVSSLVDRSASTQPLLANLLIETSDQGVQFRGTDLEAVVTVKTGGNVVRPGRTTVPAETFRDLVKLLPPMGEVSIEDTGRKVVVQCETHDYKLMNLPADDFPEWPPVPGDTKFQISQKVLKNLIDATVYALPVKDHRRVLMGIYFELNENELRLTATDGKKLARISTSIPEVEGSGTAAIVVPRKLLDNLLKTLGSEGPVEIEIASGANGPRQIAFRFDNITYRCNGIDGKYPDCDAVIPKDFPIQIDFNRDAFLLESKRAGIVTDEKSRSIILKFEDGQCHFSAMAHDLGTFVGSVAVDYNGAMMELAFNFTFLIETLSRFQNPELKMMIKNPTAPIVFKSKDEETRLSLLMPIKLADARPPAPMPEDEEEEA